MMNRILERADTNLQNETQTLSLKRKVVIFGKSEVGDEEFAFAALVEGVGDAVAVALAGKGFVAGECDALVVFFHPCADAF